MDYNVNRYQENLSLVNKTRKGRPRATTCTEDRAIVLTTQRITRQSITETATAIDAVRQKSVNVTAVKCRLFEADLHGLDTQNKQQRIIWTCEHHHCPVEEQSKVLCIG